MDRKSKIIIGLFVTVLIGIIITEIVRPKPLNWKPSYTAEDKIPMGCFVLFNELEELFSGQTVNKVEETLYNLLADEDTVGISNYILINNGIDLDQQETNALLDYVNKGNDVFIASTYFGYALSDTLRLHVNSYYNVKEDSIAVTLSNKLFSNKTYYYSRGQNNTHFTGLDTLNTTVLGHISYTENDNFLAEQVAQKQNKKEVNFVRVNFGKGHFYLSTLPEAYTNYYMLKDSHSYVANTFSYLNDRPLFWDNYKKTGRVVINSPMRFVLTQASLKWSYYLTIIGLIIFVIFRAKREQRIIPVIQPLENSSVEFAKTVGSLYLQNKDYTDLIAKKLNYFLAFIRNNYFLDTVVLSEKTAQDLAAKSGKTITETKALLDMILYLKNKTGHTEKDLIDLNRKITSFKQKDQPSNKKLMAR